MSIPAHSSFKFLRERYVESLNIGYQEFEHLATGAIHIHLSSQNTENVFLDTFSKNDFQTHRLTHRRRQNG